ncbi:MAG: type II toxin-antitoxin system VapC family toxin [Candidatus Bathyarchaeia archaeon]
MILDTDLLIALLKGETEANKAMERLDENGKRVATTILTAYELLRGAYISSKPEKNLAEVHELLSNIEVLDLTLQACEETSKIYRDLRKAGCLIGEFDTLIAAIAKTHAETLMTRDEHFTLIRGINVEEW